MFHTLVDMCYRKNTLCHPQSYTYTHEQDMRSSVYKLTGIGSASSLKCVSHRLEEKYQLSLHCPSIAFRNSLHSNCHGIRKELRSCGWMFGSGDRLEEDLLQVLFIRITVTGMCRDPSDIQARLAFRRGSQGARHLLIQFRL